MRIAVNERQRNVVEFFERALAKIENHSKRRAVYAERRQVLKDDRGDYEQKKHDRVFADDAEIDVAFADDKVDGFADDDGGEQRCCDLDDRAEQCDYDQPDVRR